MAKIPTVLIVDQDLQGRFEMKRLVQQSQFEVAGEAGLGTEGVSLAAELKPDVILCTMNEPVIRALQTLDALINALPETPIVVYSSSHEVETARRAMQAGARDFLGTPVESDELARSIMLALESEERRRMRLSGQQGLLGPRGTVITVFGSKGGIGKTTIATNLAVGMARQVEQSVVLMDGDTGFGDVADMLDLSPERTVLDLAQDIEGVTRQDLPKYLTRHSSGLVVLPAPPHTFAWRNLTPERFRRVLDLLAKGYDIVVVDTSGFLNELTVTAIEAATMVLWVTSSEFSSIKDSLQAIEALRSLSFPEERIRIMINNVSGDNGVRPDTVAEVLQREVFWQVPFDRRLRYNGHLGTPAVLRNPSSPAARSLLDLGRAIVGLKPERRGLLARLGLRPSAGSKEVPDEAAIGEESP